LLFDTSRFIAADLRRLSLRAAKVQWSTAGNASNVAFWRCKSPLEGA
jgi:hypothetical protein